MENRLKILETALSQYGIREYPGENDNNKQILKYFWILGMDWIRTDEKAWCSAAMNWICKINGLPYSGELNARSWLDIGEKTETPLPGNIVVLWRESISSWKGHVGVFIKHDHKNVWILGGNQSNMFKISKYPKFKVLNYRSI